MKSPFKFLDYFDKEDHGSFFGRKEETERLYKLVNTHRLTLVYGPSGTGKTSLIRCGLGNRFDLSDWKPLYINRRQNINASLRERLEEQLEEDEDYPLPEDIVSLTEEVFKEYLRPVYLIFDQLEELFIDGSEEEQQTFAATIQALVESGITCRVIFIMREEYLGRLYEFEQLVPVRYEQRLRVDPLSRKVIEREVIASSFVLFNMVTQGDEIEPTIADNLSEGGKKRIVLPFLQVYLDRLWNHCQSSQYEGAIENQEKLPAISISDADLVSIGSFEQVFADYLNESRDAVQVGIDQAFPDEGNSDAVRKLLNGLVTDDGTKRNQAFHREQGQLLFLPPFPSGWSGLSGDVLSMLVEKLEYYRLLRVQNNSLELAHDSMASIIMQQRNDQERRDAENRQDLKSSFLRFNRTGEYLTVNQLALYNEDVLNKLGLEPAVLEFIEESKGIRAREASAAADQKIKKEKEKQERAFAEERLENERKKRRRTLMFLIMSTVMAFLAVGAVVVALFAYSKTQDALERATYNGKEARYQESLALLESEKNDSLRSIAVLEKENANVAKDEALLQSLKAESARKQADDARRLAEQESRRFQHEAAKGQLLDQTIGNSYDELISAGKEQYRLRNFQNALTYWANARFMNPESKEAAKLVQFAEQTIEADYLMHYGDWDGAEEIFKKVIVRNDIEGLTLFGETRLEQLRITRKNWTIVERELNDSSLDAITVSRPLLSFPISWTVAEEKMTSLKFIPLDDKAPYLDRFSILDTLNFQGGKPIDISPLSGLTSLGALDLSGLSGLTSLGSLDLSGTDVRDLSPLSGLTSLGSLDLSGTGVRDLSPLSGLTNLGDLDLSGTGVRDLSPLSGLTSLGSLDLSGTGVTDLSGLSGLTSLGVLYLRGTGVTDLIPLSGLTSLGDLDLSGTGVRDLIPLSGLTSLGSLDLSGTGVTDLSGLSGLTSLGGLNLMGTGVSDLIPLSGLTSLGDLDLSGTSVTDLSPLSGLTSLGDLDLSGTSVTDLSPLSGLTSLGDLDLSGTSVTDLSPLSGLTSLGEVNLERTGVMDLSPLSGLTSLGDLNLRQTGVSDLSPLSGLTSLGSLDLYRTGVSDLSPLSGLTSLGVLSLYETDVTDLSPLSGLMSLGDLYLYGTRVTDLSPLSGLTSLGNLDFPETGITDLSGLSGLTSLGDLNLSYTGVTDLSPLSGLTSLGALNLRQTGVTDLSPLSGLTSLGDLNLSYSGVTDLSPLFQIGEITMLRVALNQFPESMLTAFRAKFPSCEIIID